jgi:hypothetical protein
MDWKDLRNALLLSVGVAGIGIAVGAFVALLFVSTGVAP